MPVADNLLERMGCHLSLYEDPVPRLERIKAIKAKTIAVQELTLGVQIQRTFGHRRARSYPLIRCVLAYFDNVLGALCGMVFDGSRLIHRHHGIGYAQKHLGKLLPFICAKCLDIHDQNPKIIYRI